MKALLIDGDTQTVEEVEIAGKDDLSDLIGYETLESDAVGDAGDRLYFDEECFLRGSKGRFQIDSVIPVAGKGVIVGTADDGATLQDVVISAEELRERIKYF
jgi:hypothetical protein